jgi:molybdate transport system substrate-binding protein
MFFTLANAPSRRLALHSILGVGLVAAIGSSLPAAAAEVRLLASAAIKPAIEALAPDFEKQSGHRLIARYELTPAIPQMIEKGEPFDVTIANPPHIDGLIRSGKIAASSQANVAQFGVGVGVRSGAPRPATRSANELRDTLLKANSVAFVGAGTSGAFFRSLLERLKIADEMQARLRPGDIQPILLQLTRGEVDMVVMPVPLILAQPGAELASPLPDELQDVIMMTAGKAAAGGQGDAADRLLGFLMSPASTAVFTAKGYQRPKQ